MPSAPDYRLSNNNPYVAAYGVFVSELCPLCGTVFKVYILIRMQLAAAFDLIRTDLYNNSDVTMNVGMLEIHRLNHIIKTS